jgi:signal transduction histidine kinase
MGLPPSTTSSGDADPTTRAKARAAQRVAHHRFWRPAILLLGFAISAAVAGVVHDMLGEEAAAQREIARESLAAGLKSHVERKLDFVHTLKGLFDSSDFVSADEFHRFAELDADFRDRQWWISLAWAPRQSTLPASSRIEPGDTFPVMYLESTAETNAEASDAAADPADRAIMERAAEQHSIAVSAPRTLKLGGREAMAVKLYQPVFRDSAGGTEALQGFLIETIALDGFFNRFLSDAFIDTDLSVRLYDGSALIFASGVATESGVPQELKLGDREWRLQVGDQSRPIGTGFWLPALVFAIGIALTALLYLRLLRADTEYQRIAEEVGLATAELATANRHLAERSAALQKVADDLSRTSQEAQFANAAKTVFLANMSHELRTPLNAVIGFSEMISSRALGEASPRYFEYANDIRASGRYLLSIIEDLLDMSRIELGQMQLKEEPTALTDIVGDVIKFLTLRAREKRVNIRHEGLEPLPKVLVDPKAMRQSLINLLTNAVKFSHPGSEVVIRGDLEPGGIALSVTDHGLGIKQEDLPQIFDPFWQNEAYRRQTKEGIGLGLAITQRLIQAHDATIEVQSREGKGTTVTIHLPVSRIIRSAPRLAVVNGGSAGAA